ncbi:adenylate/guanylate cyclase domain-containing protein [Roseibium sp. HPY-6]|uniref:adenylate/guanylate cyclase domain-containing protein n=1 Tax=Roseibium sp. HPY-6 TaxID=3229852 RepID=UPI00338DE1B6
MSGLTPTDLPVAGDEIRSEMREVVDWLLTDGRELSDIGDLLEKLATRLQHKKLPLFKMFIGIQQLHPELFAETFVWEDTKGVVRIDRPHGDQKQTQFKEGPIPLILAGAEMVRVDLKENGLDLEYLQGRSLRQEGATDVVFFGLPFSGDRPQVLCLATTFAEGFSEDHIAKASSILTALATVTELMTAEATSRRLLDLYVGQDAGQRVLNGEIRRGAGQTISGVIWFCDLAGFTAMSEVLPRDELIQTLNQFFDAMAPPIEVKGGTVLKFMGDGMLAFFQLPSAKPAQTEICTAIATAAQEASNNVIVLNDSRIREGLNPLSFGIALHAGDVMYGNVGSAHRLDFTVIGPAVNYAARIEAISRTVEPKIIVSAEFHNLLNQALPSLGLHRFRGLEGEHEVFSLPNATL